MCPAPRAGVDTPPDRGACQQTDQPAHQGEAVRVDGQVRPRAVARGEEVEGRAAVRLALQHRVVQQDLPQGAGGGVL